MIEIIVEQCYQTCPFYGVSMDGMQCDHPYFSDKGAYDNMIITQDNSRGRVPDACPLRSEWAVLRAARVVLKE
jgi:hypothetical protein